MAKPRGKKEQTAKTAGGIRALIQELATKLEDAEGRALDVLTRLAPGNQDPAATASAPSAGEAPALSIQAELGYRIDQATRIDNVLELVQEMI